MNVVPTEGKLLVKQLEVPKVTSGGIHLPESCKQSNENEGTVLAVGPGKQFNNGVRVEPQVKVGDHVIFSDYPGVPVEIEDENYLIMNEDDILAVLEK